MQNLCQSKTQRIVNGADAAPASGARIPCPHCGSFDIHASRRRWTENLLRLGNIRVRRCYDCRFRFFVLVKHPWSANLFRFSDVALLAGLLFLILQIAYSAH